MRIGDASGEVRVAYETRDGSARAGVTYVRSSGVLVFGPGVGEQSIYVPIIQNERWETTVEFEVHLLRDAQLLGADLGKYLHRTRVKVIDDDSFPSSKYAEQIMEGIAGDNLSETVPHSGLFWEYFKLNFWNPDITWGCFKLIGLDQLHNLYLFAKLFLNVYLIDYVLVQSEESEDWLVLGDRMASLAFVTVCNLVPFLMLHVLDWRSSTWKVPGIATRMLQIALLRKFLNYSDASRQVVQPGQLIAAVVQDSRSVVAGGFMKGIMLLRAVGAFLVMLCFHVVSPWFFDSNFCWSAFAPCLLFPLLLPALVRARYFTTARHLKEKYNRQVDVANQISESVHNYKLIADYEKRPAAADTFDELIKQYGAANVALLQVLQNNSYIVPWLSILIVASYTVFAGTRVLEGKLSMGMFITNVNIFTAVGQACGNIYTVVLDIQKVFPELERIVRFINLDIDVNERMKLGRHRRRHTKTWFEVLQGQDRVSHDETPLVDRMPIMLEDVMTEAMSGIHALHLKNIQPFNVQFHQGRLIALLGPHGEGKSTFMRTIGGFSMPRLRAGSIFFIPAHLRVLHIPAEPMFFKGTLYGNLIFGCSHGDPDADRGRVRRICERLTLPAHIVSLIELSDADAASEDVHWHHNLSQTQRYLLCIGRALVANPEILVIHKPTGLLNEDATVATLKLLREFVDKRGIEQEEGRMHMRRPRTCIFTTSTGDRREVDIADDIFRVTSRRGVEAVSRHRLSQLMLDVESRN